ncbi:hypothetical protein ACLOJK_027481 [Asimina triloba]
MPSLDFRGNIPFKPPAGLGIPFIHTIRRLGLTTSPCSAPVSTTPRLASKPTLCSTPATIASRLASKATPLHSYRYNSSNLLPRLRLAPLLLPGMLPRPCPAPLLLPSLPDLLLGQCLALLLSLLLPGLPSMLCPAYSCSCRSLVCSQGCALLHSNRYHSLACFQGRASLLLLSLSLLGLLLRLHPAPLLPLSLLSLLPRLCSAHALVVAVPRPSPKAACSTPDAGAPQHPGLLLRLLTQFPPKAITLAAVSLLAIRPSLKAIYFTHAIMSLLSPQPSAKAAFSTLGAGSSQNPNLLPRPPALHLLLVLHSTLAFS